MAANRRGRANRIENVYRIGASWETVRDDGGLASPVFVRTLQDKLNCPRSAHAMRAFKVHPRHELFPADQPALDRVFQSTMRSVKKIGSATRRDDVTAKLNGCQFRASDGLTDPQNRPSSRHYNDKRWPSRETAFVCPFSGGSFRVGWRTGNTTPCTREYRSPPCRGS